MIPKAIADKPRMTKEFREELAGKYVHGEAFCHMLYVSDDGRQSEWLWNSRDGVTPFVISSATGKKMSHNNWGEDRFDPDYKPVEGDRIFVDCTKELIEGKAWERARNYWDDALYPLNKRFKTPDEAARRFIEEWTKPGSPYVQTVTA